MTHRPVRPGCEACEFLQAAIELQPEFASPYYQRAALALIRGDSKAAIVDFRKYQELGAEGKPEEVERLIRLASS